MLPAAILVIFIIAEPEGPPNTEVFERAALAVLGAEAQLEVRSVNADPDDDDAVQQAKGADGVVELSWSKDRMTARLHCYIASQRRWVSRSIVFGNADQPSERERMLGFAIASMFTADDTPTREDSEEPREPKIRTPDVPAPATPAPASPQRVDALETVSTPARANSPRESQAGEADESSDEGSTASTPRAPAESPRDLHFAAVASTGISGQADSVGAMAALDNPLTGPLWIRLSLAGRSGELPAAQASTRTLNGGVGLTWTFADSLSGSNSWYDAALNINLLAGWFEVGHLSEDDPRVVRKSRWQLGMDVVLSGGIDLSANTLVYAGAGLELVFGRTEVYTHGAKVAVVPPLRALGQLGIRTRF